MGLKWLLYIYPQSLLKKAKANPLNYLDNSEFSNIFEFK